MVTCISPAMSPASTAVLSGSSCIGQLCIWEKHVIQAHESGSLAWHYQQPLAAKTENGAKLNIYNDEPVDSNYYVFDLFGAGSASLVAERRRGDGLIVAGGPSPDNETYTVTLQPGEGSWTALGIDVVQDETLPGVRLSRGADRFVLTQVEAELSPGGGQESRPLSFVLATASSLSGDAPEHKAMAAIDDDPQTGWGVAGGQGLNPFLALRFAEKVQTSGASVLTVQLEHGSRFRGATMGRFRLALSAGEHSWPEIGLAVDKVRQRPAGSEAGSLITQVERGLPGKVLEALRIPETDRDEEQKSLVTDHFAWMQPELEELIARIGTLQAELGVLNAAIPVVVVSESTEPRVTRILPRGNWMDDSGEVVQPAIPEFFGKLETNGSGARRLDFANWVVSDDNPLTARVYVNRLWSRFFGTGISKVLDDVGSQGEWPSNLELLDWLAADFRDPSWQAGGTHRWDVKHIIRTIVTSHTYRQSSQSTPELNERDRNNRLLARQSRFRVEAENVRDIALAISGLLVEKFGGPSVRPYQPDGYLAAMNFPMRRYSASRGEDLYRRGLYTHWQRTFLHPSLMTFDAPSREECTVNRTRSNTPLQALVLLNDPVFVEAARALAQNILLETGEGFEAQLDQAFLAALSRTPVEQERETLTGLYNTSLAKFKAKPKAAREFLSVGEAPLADGLDTVQLAALTTVTRAVLNLHETITRN